MPKRVRTGGALNEVTELPTRGILSTRGVPVDVTLEEASWLDALGWEEPPQAAAVKRRSKDE